MTEYYEPKFVYGPKDGGYVPMPLWALDEITLEQKLSNGKTMLYYYKLDSETKDYIYDGQSEDNDA